VSSGSGEPLNVGRVQARRVRVQACRVRRQRRYNTGITLRCVSFESPMRLAEYQSVCLVVSNLTGFLQGADDSLFSNVCVQ
jgi:hypothetical protein